MTAKSTYAPVPLDFLLLEMMPEKGMLAGVHWKGRRAKDLLEELKSTQPEMAPYLTNNTVQARLRSLHVYGKAEPFGSIGSGGGKIWARTPDGTELLARKEEILG